MDTGNQGTLSRKFVFRKHASIGCADAIEDRKFLEAAFIDNGSLDKLADPQDPVAIVVGRTGSGKTALLEKLHELKENVIRFNPETLALTYVTSSDILKFFMEAGVNLDLFFRLLWRHVFAVEIIRQHYHIVNETANDSFWDKMRQLFARDSAKHQALEYLKNFGESFWQESELRVKEITKTLEKDLSASIDAGLAFPSGSNTSLTFTAGTARKLTEEQKADVVRRGQEIVNKVQVSTLSKIMEILETDLLDDKKKRYYITVDRLDEAWVHDEYRYALIKALIETLRDFNHKITNVKVIIAIREDLLDRVFRFTRSAGYQEEKYRSLYLTLRWTMTELQQLLDKRVNHLIKEQYTGYSVKVADLFPNRIQKQEPLEYFLERTLLRPRDAILFFNECIKAAEGQAKFTQATVLAAEATYSEMRLRALADEWTSDFPNLFELALFLKKFPSQFKLSLLHDSIQDLALRYLTSSVVQDDVYRTIYTMFEGDDRNGLIAEILKVLFRVGIIGVKTETFQTVQWAHIGSRKVLGEIGTETLVQVHPAFWRVLGIQPIKV